MTTNGRTAETMDEVDSNRIYQDAEGWWHTDHPLEPSQDCCSHALEEVFKALERAVEG